MELVFAAAIFIVIFLTGFWLLGISGDEPQPKFTGTKPKYPRPTDPPPDTRTTSTRRVRIVRKGSRACIYSASWSYIGDLDLLDLYLFVTILDDFEDTCDVPEHYFSEEAEVPCDHEDYEGSDECVTEETYSESYVDSYNDSYDSDYDSGYDSDSDYDFGSDD